MAKRRDQIGAGIATIPPSRPTQVFQSPNGLLDFLGTKTVGHNPDLFSQVLQPSLDLMAFYVAGQELKRVSVGISNPSAGSGFPNAFFVPAGRAWIPLFHCIEMVGGGGAGQVRAKPAVFDPAGAVIAAPSPVAQGASAAAASRAVCGFEWFQNPIIVPAGFGFGYYVEFAVADAANSITTVLTYIELVV